MNRAQRMILWLAEKAYNTIASFSTVNAPQDFYTSEGYYGIARALYGYGEREALQSAAVFGCVKILGEDVGSLPLELYERRRGDARKIADGHRLYDLLHNEPNPDTSAMEFREVLTSHAALCGVGYARKARNSEGELVALWQLQPDQVTLDHNPFGAPFYRVRDERGREETVSPSDMFVLRGFGFDGRKGASILEIARKTIGLTVMQTDYAWRYFNQDQTPPIAVKFPTSLGPTAIQKFKDAWKAYHSGPDRWHTPAVIGEGGDIVQLRPTAEQTQLVEQRRFQIGEVCRLFRMPPHKLADLERATFSNIENLNRHYYTETLRPWLVRWEQSIRRQLLSPEEKPRYYAEHTIEGLLRGDFKTQTEGFARLLEKGVFSINEVRSLLNWNPIEGGDEHFIQLNMQSVSQAVTGELIDEGTKPVPVRKGYVNGGVHASNANTSLFHV